MTVTEGERVIAVAPAFRIVFHIGMNMTGRSRVVRDWLAGRLPHVLDIDVVGLGSPHADELVIGFAEDLDQAGRQRALSVMLDGLEQHAAATKADAVFLKNVSDPERNAWDPVFAEKGFTGLRSLPIAFLDVPESLDAYVDSLSANMRSNIRRKLKRAKSIRVEERRSVAGLEEQIVALRESTRARAGADYGEFEGVNPKYFQAVLDRLGDDARLLLFWLKDDLIGFAIVIFEKEQLIEKFTGLKYPEATDHGVYFLNWTTQIGMAIERGIPRIRAGETTYLTKHRLGCKLERSWVYFRHRRKVPNWILRKSRRWINFDDMDPDLKKVGDVVEYIEPR